MNEMIKVFLNSKGYTCNETALDRISTCHDWYSNEPISHFHDRVSLNGNHYNIMRLNFAKRCCSDDANLCEVVEITAGSNEETDKTIKEIMESNNFDCMYRQQLELISALGTAAGYISLDNAELMKDGKVQNGTVAINYVQADGFFPLTVVNNEIMEAAFAGEQLTDGEIEYTVVVFTLDNGKYQASTYHLDKSGEEIADRTVTLQLAEVKPFFVMRNAEVNNLDNMTGYGLPKLWNAVPLLKVMDLAFNIFFSDLDKGEKILLVNELLCQYDKEGNPVLTPEQKKLFVMMGEKLPDADTLIHEYNPEIRIEQITKSFETALSLLSMMFGYGTKKYTFENGKITTATEYIGTKQDQMQELNRQRYEAKQYITDVIDAIIWFSNTFNGTAMAIEDEVTIDFNDSYITDKESELERKRNDALSFDIPELTVWYLMDAYALSEEEATELVMQKQDKEEPDVPED